MSSEDLANEDFLLSDFEFAGKTYVISGGSDRNKNALKSKIEEIGGKVTSSISGKTDVFIIGEDVGPSKKEKAISQKEQRPDSFHIFTQESVAEELGISLS